MQNLRDSRFILGALAAVLAFAPAVAAQEERPRPVKPTEAERAQAERQEQERAQKAREQAEREERERRARQAREQAERAERAERIEQVERSRRAEQARDEKGREVRVQGERIGREVAPIEASARTPQEVRAMAGEVFALERVHRDRRARMQRLMDVYRQQGNMERVGQIERMMRLENQRYARNMERYQSALPPATFARIRAVAGNAGEGAPEKGLPQRAEQAREAAERAERAERIDQVERAREEAKEREREEPPRARERAGGGERPDETPKPPERTGGGRG